MKFRVMAWLFLPGCLGLAPEARAQAGTNVAVAFYTTNSTPLNPGFGGFCTEMLTDAVEYSDTNFQQITATLSPGWLRYPGGATSDAFEWTNGLTVTNWIPEFPAAESNLLSPTVTLLSGKGGAQFTDFASMCANVGGAKIVVCINGFTDTSNSAGAFAAFALTNHIQVAAWELCNEPYVFAGNSPGDFFLDATNYAAKMRPYRDAIKAADSNAVVAIYFDDAGYTEPTTWDVALSNYPDKYWDAVVYHHYPSMPANAAFSDLMARDNWQLASNTTARMLNYLIPMNNSNVTFLITEYAPAVGDGTGGQTPPTATLYGGIYAAEYLLRLSTLPQMHFVGPYQLVDPAGIDMTNNYNSAVADAYNKDRTTNTAGLPFGFYLSAQVCGSALANWALTRSTAVYLTTVGTNCPLVTMENATSTNTLAAIYAQAYQGGNGKRYVMLTNKGSNAVPVQITQDGAVLTNQFLETYMTGSDPSVTNAFPPDNSIQLQTNTTANPVTIPEYSVVRLEWTVFDVPSPVVHVSYTNATPALLWTGLTNVVYDVQSLGNFPGMWATLEKISSAQTNFSTTDPDPGWQRYYRLIIP
jgi:hypothetical protein